MAGYGSNHKALHPTQLPTIRVDDTGHISDPEPGPETNPVDSTTTATDPTRDYWKPPLKISQQLVKIKIQVILEQCVSGSPTLKLDYGPITFWEQDKFYQKPHFYLTALAEASSKIIHSEPYKWIDHILQFYPTNVRFEYQNKYDRRTIIKPGNLSEETLAAGGQCFAEEPKFDTTQETPRAFIILRLGMVPSIEQVSTINPFHHLINSTTQTPAQNYLQEDQMSNSSQTLVAEPVESEVSQVRYIEYRQNGILPSVDDVRRTPLQPTIRSAEERQLIINDHIGQEARIMLQQFVHQMKKLQDDETDGDILMRFYIRHINELMRRYSIVDERAPKVEIIDKRSIIIEPIPGTRGKGRRVLYLGEPTWNQGQNQHRASRLY